MNNYEKTDYHIHSEWSPDSRMPIQEALESCQKQEIDDIAFTEHLDIGIQHDKHAYEKLNQYTAVLEKVKSHYPMMNILTGIEAGVNTANLDSTEAYLDSCKYEFIIFSIHASKGIPFCSQRAYQKCGHQELLRLYFNEMLYTVTHGKHYHALGHMDYILRYQPYSLEEFLGYEKEIRQILEQLIQHQAALEINSKGFQSLNRPHPPIEILKWYQEMGGNLLVIGSDAHKSSQIGENFQDSIEWLKQAGFFHYQVIREGNWQKVNL